MAQTFILIGSASVTSQTATITFSNISTSYKSLVARISTRSTRGVPSDPIRTFINNDTTNGNYEYGVSYINTSEYGMISGSSAESPAYASGSLPSSNIFGVVEMVYINSNATNTTRSAMGSFTMADLSTSSSNWYYIVGGSRHTSNSSAITQIDFQVTDTGYPFIVDSRIDLYGLS